MHHGILIKANGKNLKDAKCQVEGILDQTLACGECGRSKQNVNWDYHNFLGEVTNAWVKNNKADKDVKTVEDLVKWYIDYRQEAVKDREKRITEELKTVNATFKETGHYPTNSMLGYYMDSLEDIHNVIKYGDSEDGIYSLHCTENHYADLTEYTDGKKAFYMWFDRHF